MSVGLGQFGIPGVQSAQMTTTKQLFWGGGEDKIEILRKDGVVVSSAARDAGASPTTVLRSGLLMALVASSGQAVQWDAANTDAPGTEQLFCVNEHEQYMLDFLGNAQNRLPPMIVKAPLKAKELLIKGASLIGHADEYLARRSLHAMGCRLDDDPQGYLAGEFKRYSTKITSYTVVAADNGTTFRATTADATFTLPAIKAGLAFEFIRIDDFEMVVASAEGGNMIVGNDAAANSITFTTAGQQIGARVKVSAEYVNGTLKWVAELPYTPFGTGLATLAFAIAT